MNIVTLSLGSNLGDRGANIKKAVRLLEKYFKTKLKKSPLYESRPFYEDQLDQGDYYNCCVSFESNLSVKEIFKITSRIEKEMGRKKEIINAPRVIDIDIIFVGDEIWTDDEFSVPHTKIQDRRFVLKPLCDILPDFTHPVLQLTVDDLLYECPDDNKIEEIKNFWRKK